jgi:hypothetical protein
MWVNFNNPDGSLIEVIDLENPSQSEFTPYSIAGKPTNTFYGTALDSSKVAVSPRTFFTTRSGTIFLSVPGGGYFRIEPQTSGVTDPITGISGAYGFFIDWPVEQPQTITFAIPKVTLSGTDDFGQPITQQVEIYDSFQYRGGEGLPPYESDEVTLNASSSSELTNFTYTSSDPTVAVISNTNKLKMLKREAVTITASQAGDANWLPASASVTITPTGLKLGQTITVVAPERMNVGAFANFSYSASSGLPVQSIIHSPDIVKLAADGRLNALRPGGCAIAFSQDGGEEYEPEDKTIVILVDGLPQTLTFATVPPDLKVGDVVNLSATSSAGLTVSFTSSDPAIMSLVGNVLTINRQGYSKITAKAADSLTYNPASSSQEVAVGRGVQTLFFPEIPSVPYGAGAIKLVASATSELPVTAASSNPLVAVVSNGEIIVNGVGNTTITVSQAGNAYWLAAPSLDRLLSVVKSPQAITLSELPSQINISEKVLLKGTSSSGGAVTFFVSGALSLVEENGSFYITGVAEGQGTVTATVAGDANYEAVSVDFDVAVGRLSQEIVFPLIEPRTFNFRSFSLTASATSGLPVSFSSSVPAVASVSASGAVTVNKVGVTTITASQAGDAEWNAATSLQRFLVVDKAEQLISFFPPAPVPSTTASIALSASAPGGAVVFKSSNSQVVEINGSVAVIRGVGAARIVATQAGSGDYMPAVAVVPIFVVPVIDSVTTPANNITDQATHVSTSASPSTNAVAVVMGAPTTLDREGHNSLLASPTLNTGETVPPNAVLDQSAFSSREVSTVFTGTSQTLAGGSDHESYLAGTSPVFSGSSVVMSAMTEQDLSSYAAYVASVADHAASECVRAKYDGRGSFEVYSASSPSAPEGYLLIQGGAYLLWRRTNEDDKLFTGKIII